MVSENYKDNFNLLTQIKSSHTPKSDPWSIGGFQYKETEEKEKREEREMWYLGWKGKYFHS